MPQGNRMKDLNITVKTMSSTQLKEVLNYDSKSSVNKAIRNMFSDKIDDSVIESSLDTRGYVNEYFLQELESKMFVAKNNIEYLEMITQYWIDRNKPKEVMKPVKVERLDLNNQINIEYNILVKEKSKLMAKEILERECSFVQEKEVRVLGISENDEVKELYTPLEVAEIYEEDSIHNDDYNRKLMSKKYHKLLREAGWIVGQNKNIQITKEGEKNGGVRTKTASSHWSVSFPPEQWALLMFPTDVEN